MNRYQPLVALAFAGIFGFGAEARAENETPSVLAPPAPEPPRFGEKGQIVLSNYSSLSIGHTGFSDSDAETFAVAVAPGIDWFVADRISLGLDLAVSYSSTRGYGSDGGLVSTNTTSYGGGVRIAVAFPIGKRVTFYPRLTLGGATKTSNQSVATGGAALVASYDAPSASAEKSLTAVLNAPFLFHIAPHFFIGIGPSVSRDLARTHAAIEGQNLATSFGVGFIVGGYL